MVVDKRSLRYTHENHFLYSTYFSETNIQNNNVFVTCKYYSYTWNIEDSHIIIHFISIQLFLRLSSYLSKKLFLDILSESAFYANFNRNIISIRIFYQKYYFKNIFSNIILQKYFFKNIFQKIITQKLLLRFLKTWTF